MKNSTRLLLIIVCVVLILVLLSILFWGILNPEFIEEGSLQIRKEEMFEIEQIEKIIVKSKSADIKFYRTGESKIRVVQKSSKKIKEQDLFRISNNGSELIIEDDFKAFHFCIGFCFYPQTIYEIYVPNSYQNNIQVASLSGDILIEGLEQVANLELTTKSGDIELKNKVIADRVHLESISGDIDAVSIKSASIVIRSISGDIQNKMLEGEKIQLKTTSGDIENNRMKGQVEITTVSGEIETDYFDITGDSTINSTSGDIDIEFPSQASCKMSASSISGDVSFPHSESIIGTGEYQVFFKTVSGDISVKVITDNVTN